MTTVEQIAITQHDVLLGRGSRCALHVGSIAFKAVVISRLNSYLESTSSTAKTRLTLGIVESVHLSGGRFLAKLEKKDNKKSKRGINNNTCGWYEVDKEASRIKVRDTLRDCIKSVRKDESPSVLLDNIGLSEVFGRNSPFGHIVEHVAKSSHVRTYIPICGRRNEPRALSEPKLPPPTCPKQFATLPSVSNSFRNEIGVELLSSTNERQHEPYSQYSDAQRSTFLKLSISTSSRVVVPENTVPDSSDEAIDPLFNTACDVSTKKKSTSTGTIFVGNLQDELGDGSRLSPVVVVAEETIHSKGMKRKMNAEHEGQKRALQNVVRGEFSRPSLRIQPSKPSVSSTSGLNLLGVQCPWKSLVSCEGTAQHHPVSLLTNTNEGYLDYGDRQPMRSSFSSLSLESLLALDSKERPASNTIEKAIALSREEDNSALLDYCFSQTTELVLRNKHRREQKPERCCLCNETHDTNLWSGNEPNLPLFDGAWFR